MQIKPKTISCVAGLELNILGRLLSNLCVKLIIMIAYDVMIVFEDAREALGLLIIKIFKSNISTH